MSDHLIPSKPLDARQEAILKALRLGNTRTTAAAYAGVSRETLYAWMRESLTFSDAVIEAEASAEVGHVECIAKAASKGSWMASAWWLERRRPKQWREIKTLDIRNIPTETLIAILESEDSGGTDEEEGERT